MKIGFLTVPRIMGMPEIMDEDDRDFSIYRAPNAKFYIMRQGEAVCTRTGQLVYFETERDALEFLAEIGDVVLN